MSTGKRKQPQGIRVRHARRCPAHDGGRCSCDPSYEAFVSDRRRRRKIRRTFPTLAAARAWRHDAHVALRRGTLAAGSSVTVRQAADTWLAGARAGTIVNRSGDPYKPSAIRSYDDALRLRVLPTFGGVRLADLRRSDLQRFVSRLQGDGLSASTIRNSLMPLRAIYAEARDDVPVNPTAGVKLPAVRNRRDRAASPVQAAALLAALPERDRALWSTAMYAGLRRGELLALRWRDVRLQSGVIRVSSAWDRADGEIEPKSRAGRRTVPIPAALRTPLAAHKLATGRADDALCFGRDADRPFDPSTVHDRARRAWQAANDRVIEAATDAGRDADPSELLEPIGLHECRHTFASLMIAAGVNAKALATFMGHSSIAITLDLYGHLLPGAEDEAAGLLDTYLANATAAH